MAKMTHIRRNDGASIPRRLVCVDCEAYINDNSGEDRHEIQTFRIACAMSARIRGSDVSDISSPAFYEPQAFWEWIDSISVARGTTWLVAHNLVYDLTLLGIWELIIKQEYRFAYWYEASETTLNKGEQHGSRLPMVILSDPPTIIGLINRSGHKIICVDSLNYYRCPLTEMGVSLGYPKWDLPPQHAEQWEWERYCRRDVKILFDSMVKLIKWWLSADLGNWAYTTPSLAMHAFRHKFLDYHIAAHNEPEIRLLERSAYSGGRVEAYWLGEIKGLCYLVDVASLYPAMMHEHDLPAMLWDWKHRDELTREAPPYEPETMIAEVCISNPQATFPLRTSKGVIYPKGTFVTTLAGPELAIAVKAGRVHYWGSWSHYLMAPLGKNYVAYFWLMKHKAEVEGNKMDAEFNKMMMNSLPGKWGERSARWQYMPDETPAYVFRECIDRFHPSGERRHLLHLYNHVYIRQPEGEIKKSIPAIPAFINSAARVFMARAMHKAGREHCYYISTDALIVDSAGLNGLHNAGLVNDNSLGKFRIKHTGINGHIGGIHNYRIGDHAVFGGVPLGKRPDAYGQWEHHQFPGLQEIIASGGKSSIRVERFMKGLRAAYDRRRKIGENETEAWEFNDLPNSFTITGFRWLLANAGELTAFIR